MKKWKYHPDQCDFCGSDAEIYTDEELEEGWGYDGDPMRCTECEAVGHWTVYDEDEAYSNWYENSDNTAVHSDGANASRCNSCPVPLSENCHLCDPV